MKASYLIPLAMLLAGCQQATVQTGAGGSGTSSTIQSSTTGTAEHVDSLERTYHLKDLQRETLKANGHDIKAWVMDDDGKRKEGMMHLTADDVADNDGMIFAFPDSKDQSFWMENTILALDIIYISPQKKVLNIQEGQPFNLDSLPSKGPAQFVLEMKQGAAKRLGIQAGTEITIPDKIKGK